jgi:rare lipoprotein A
MRSTSKFTSQHIITFLALSAVALVVASPASAGKRTPAPIVFAGQGGQAPDTRANSSVRTAMPAPGQERARIVFQYPGQGAASAPAARQYASAAAPQQSAPIQMTEPVQMTPRLPAPVESVALAALAPQDQPAGQGTAGAVQRPGVTPAAAYPVAPSATPVFDELGVGVVYGDEFAGLPTANGETFTQGGMTAAHPTLPLPSLVQVINMDTQREVVVRVNDRGPFEDGAMLQVSRKAADVLGFGGAGKANVRVRYLGPAPVGGQSGTQTAYNPPAATLTLANYAPESTYAEPVQAQYSVPAEPAMPTYTQAPSRAAGDYFVQVGSFTDIGNAQDMQAQLGQGLPVVIVPARVNGADYFRVRVGPFDGRLPAVTMKDQLASRGVSGARVVTDQ